VDPTRPEVHAKLFEPYGVSVLDVQVFDNPNSLARVGQPEEVRSNRMVNPTSIVAGPIGSRLPIHVGPARALTIGPDRAVGAHANAMLVGSEQARAAPVEWQEGERRMVVVRGREDALRKPFYGVECWRSVDTRGKEARVVLLAGHKLLLPDAGNRDLVLNALNWLGDRPASISINPRDDLVARIDPVSDAFQSILWLAVVALPGLALLAALVCYFVRRS
jgi:hypothetical protein